MYWPEQAQLGLPDKGRVIKGLVVCGVFDHIIMHIFKKDIARDNQNKIT